MSDLDLDQEEIALSEEEAKIMEEVVEVEKRNPTLAQAPQMILLLIFPTEEFFPAASVGFVFLNSVI